MEVSIQRTNDVANYLKQAQNAQVEALAEAMTKSELFDALLEKVTIAAAGLHSVIDDATVKFKRTPGLHSGGISTWTICALLLVLIGAQNMRIAISLFFLILGKFLLSPASMALS